MQSFYLRVLIAGSCPFGVSYLKPISPTYIASNVTKVCARQDDFLELDTEITSLDTKNPCGA